MPPAWRARACEPVPTGRKRSSLYPGTRDRGARSGGGLTGGWLVCAGNVRDALRKSLFGGVKGGAMYARAGPLVPHVQRGVLQRAPAPFTPCLCEWPARAPGAF